MAYVEISEKQLKDYIFCPVYYSIKYGGKLKVERPPTMPKLLRRIASGFCSDLADGKVQGLHMLKRKWSMYCNEHPEILNETKNRLGIDLLYRMYLWAEQIELRVAAVGTPYTIRIKAGSDIIMYHGQLGTIAVDKGNQPENLIMDFGSKITDQADIDLNLKTTLDHIGFGTLYEGNLAGTHVHHIKSGHDLFTNRDIGAEKDRVATIIKNVVRSIQENIWYPRESPFCSSCVTRDFCLLYGRQKT